MHIRVRPILMALGAAATAMALGTGPAAAGGPTSVLIVNPVTGATGALYAADGDYQVLQDSLAPAPGISVERPPQLSGGPGTPAINITWLIHDVSVWRVDRVRLDLKYVWVQTNVLADGTTPFDGSGEWHLAADPQAVVDVLDRVGVLPDEWVADSAGSITESGSGTGKPADTGQAAVPAGTQPANPDIIPSWQWLAVAAIGGVLLGTVGRPAMAAYVRRSAQESQKPVVDPDDGTESGQADPDPAKAPSLVLDLGDLYPADLPR